MKNCPICYQDNHGHKNICPRYPIRGPMEPVYEQAKEADIRKGSQQQASTEDETPIN